MSLKKSRTFLPQNVYVCVPSYNKITLQNSQLYLKDFVLTLCVCAINTLLRIYYILDRERDWKPASQTQVTAFLCTQGVVEEMVQKK